MAKKKLPTPQTSTQASTNDGAATASGRRRSKDVAQANDRSTATGTTVTTSEEVLAASNTESDVLSSPHDGGGSSSSPSYDEIAQAAYQRYLERGGGHGRDFEDWVEAERQLSSRRSG
jgi:hypothetical protein